MKLKIYLFIKYSIDKIIALAALVLLSPLMIAISIAVAADSKGAAIFRQPREGQNRQIIRIFKFRTMKAKNVAFDKFNPVIEDDNENVTRVGKILRKYKLDELPQLINVLIGDMSFVGPRPLLPIYSATYEKWEYMKFASRPGMTGLAQVNGNGYLSIQGRSYYDIYYNEHISFITDCKIFFKTLFTVLSGEKKYLKEPPAELIAEMKAKYE